MIELSKEVYCTEETDAAEMHRMETEGGENSKTRNNSMQGLAGLRRLCKDRHLEASIQIK